MIISTCNRTELYCGLEDDTTPVIINWLSQYHNVSSQLLERHLYTYEQVEVVRHLLRVACGLDSMILGEAQILGLFYGRYCCPPRY